MNELQLNPFAMMAALLFNFGETEPVTITPDDGGESVEVDAEVVVIEKEGNTLACMIPLSKVLKYMEQPYAMKTEIRSGVMLLTFEKHDKAPLLVTPGGKAIATGESRVLDRLLERMK